MSPGEDRPAPGSGQQASATSPEYLDALEPGQLVAALARPLPRKAISSAVSVLLWSLRLVLLALTALVVYTFVTGL
jgi:hypothetical protein